jgi:hypothetical protein
MSRKSTDGFTALTEEALKALFEHINLARRTQGLCPLKPSNSEFWSFSQDLYEAEIAYKGNRPTKATTEKAVQQARTQAVRARKAFIKLQHIVEPFGAEFNDLRRVINPLRDLELRLEGIRPAPNSPQRIVRAAPHLILAWEKYTGDKAQVLRPGSLGMEQRNRYGPIADFFNDFLDAIDPGHGYNNVARSLEIIVAKFNTRIITPQK